MNLSELLLKNRSYRRFYQDEAIGVEELKAMVEHVRLAPSGANMQPWKFVLVTDKSVKEKLFPHLRWAGYIKDWDGPVEGERPAAYIVMLGNPKKSPGIAVDYGIAMQTVLLSAVEKGYGGCLLGSIDRDAIRELLEIPEELNISVVIALGKPKETVVIDEAKDGDIKYWRDENQVHHVPKRPLADIIFGIK